MNNKIRILVVDDHAMMRDGIRALLGLHDDIEIVGEAAEGKEAIEKAQELSPDVVVMDIAMPGMDGLEATRRLTKKNPGIKIIALTQHDNREYILSSIKAGAEGYVSKKAVGSELASAIHAVQRGDSFLSQYAAKALVEHFQQQAGETEPRDLLTAREKEILKLIVEGRTSREIGATLFISLKTVLVHRTRIMEKLNIHNRTELIKYAVRKGLVTMDS